MKIAIEIQEKSTNRLQNTAKKAKKSNFLPQNSFFQWYCGFNGLLSPAAADTILTHLRDTGRKADYYDLIITGDLGALGSRILKDLTWEKGVEIQANHVDCGEIIYNVIEDEFQGGSGAGCSAVVFGSYIFDKLKKRELNRILLCATGALLSTVSSGQGESIPCICHAVAVENV